MSKQTDPVVQFPLLFDESAYGRPRQFEQQPQLDFPISNEKDVLRDPPTKKARPSDIPAKHPEVRDNTFLKVYCAKSLASICQTNEEPLLYHRPELGRVLSELSSSLYRPRTITAPITVLEGPPGCGKSSAMWIIMGVLAKKHPDTVVVWINTLAWRRIVMHEGNVQTDHIGGLTDFSKVSWNGIELIPTVVVFDGLNDSYQFANFWNDVIITLHNSYSIGNIFVVSSVNSVQQIQMPLEEGVGRKRVNSISMEAWSLQDYIAAATNGDFWESVRAVVGANTSRDITFTEEQKEIVLRRKYAIAGASARWMFDMNVEDVLRAIDYHIGNVPDFKLLLKAHYVGGRPVAVNHLTHTKYGMLLLVSEVVASKIASKCELAALTAMTSFVLSHSNPELDSMVLKMDVLHAIRHGRVANRFKRVVNNRLDEEFDNSFTKGKVFDFFRDEPQPLLANQTFAAGHYFFPEVFNQGGFDCAVLLESTKQMGALKVRFLQVTCAYHHKIRMQYMRLFVYALNQFIGARAPVAEFEVLMVVPMCDAVSLKLPDGANIEGTCGKQEGEEGYEDYHYQVVGFVRARN